MMSNYYERLGVEQHASVEQIKKAYKQLALTLHPDRLSGNTEAFQQLSEAYETLVDPQKRRVYDNSLSLTANPGASHSRLLSQRLRYYLPPNPDSYDHYNYVNELFQLKGTARLIPGQIINNKDALWEKISYVSTLIYNEEDRLQWYNPKPTGAVKKRINQINQQMPKLGQVSFILCSHEKDRKQLYDLSLGLEKSPEMLAIQELIGGQQVLIKHLKEHPDIKSSGAIFALYKANLLTPATFQQLAQCGKNLADVSPTVGRLSTASLLTAENFALLIQHQQYACEISCGMGRIKREGILNQYYFEVLVSAGKDAKALGTNLEVLQLFKLLNEANYQMLVSKIPKADVWEKLLAMDKQGLLTQERANALHWVGPEETTILLQHIDKLMAHGLFLLSCDRKKGQEAMLLALDLRQELKSFFGKSLYEQQQTKEQFNLHFIDKLHASDKDMSVHRTAWKAIIGNILIAFTGLGLFAIGINIALTGRGFFAQTKREQILEQAEDDWLIVSQAVMH